MWLSYNAVMSLSLLLAVLASQSRSGLATFDGTAHTPSKIALCTEYGGMRIVRAGAKVAEVWKETGQRYLYPSWSPDGKSIAFCARYGDSNTSVWVADEHGRNRRAITKGLAFAYAPSWTPDGKSVIYDEGGLKAYNLATGRVTQIATSGRYAWSPDGRHLAVFRANPKLKRAYENFERGEFPPNDIWLLDSRLQTVKPLTSDSWYGDIQWLDSATLVASRVTAKKFDGDGYHLDWYKVSIRTGKRERLPIPGMVHYICFSPDRRYVAEIDEPALYVRDLRTGKRRLIDKNIYPYSLTWSLDGRWLYFDKQSPEPKEGYADTQQVWRGDTRTWRLEQLSRQPEMYDCFLYEPAYGTVIYRSDKSELCLSNAKHRKLRIGSTPNFDDGAVYWGR